MKNPAVIIALFWTCINILNAQETSNVRQLTNGACSGRFRQMVSGRKKDSLYQHTVREFRYMDYGYKYQKNKETSSENYPDG